MEKKRSIVREREALSLAEYQGIIAACDGLSADPQYNQHWSLLFKGLWESGLRVNELLGLTWDLVEPGALVIRALKTRKTLELRRQPVPSWYTEELVTFPLRFNFRARGRVFPWHDTHVRRQLTKLGQLAGISRDLNPHLFRHGYGHRMAARLEEENVSAVRQVTLLKGLMGHKGRGLDSVARYQRPTSAEIEETARRIFSH